MRAWVDLTGLDAGEYMLPVQIQIAPRLVRLVSQDPEQVAIELEPLVTQILSNHCPAGRHPTYRLSGRIACDHPRDAVVTGPESSVAKVKGLRAVVDINGENETVNKTCRLSLTMQMGEW